MRIRTLGRFSVSISLLVLFIEFSTLHSGQRPSVEVRVERNERISRDEARFRVKVTNRSDRPVFLTGISDELGPRLDPLYLEQWRTTEGWKTVAPCMDTPPPHVIKLNPGEAMTSDRWLKLPPPAICKEQNIQLEGKFRIRVEYFASEKEARAYVKKLFSPDWREARAAVVALSEPFEIPSTPSREP